MPFAGHKRRRGHKLRDSLLRRAVICTIKTLPLLLLHVDFAARLPSFNALHLHGSEPGRGASETVPPCHQCKLLHDNNLAGAPFLEVKEGRLLCEDLLEIKSSAAAD